MFLSLQKNYDYIFFGIIFYIFLLSKMFNILLYTIFISFYSRWLIIPDIMSSIKEKIILITLLSDSR